MTTVRIAVLGPLFLAALVALLSPAMAQPPAGGGPLASRELDVEGVVAEVIEANRKEGVLAVRVRFRNTGDAPAKFLLVGVQGYVDTYAISGDTKYALLQDESGKQLASPRDGGGWLEVTLKPKATWNWWGKFPAPPADRKTFDLYLRVGPPIDGVPIVDKP